MGSYRVVLKMILLVVFIGWLLVWTLMPTKTFKNKWTPKLKTKLNSTYFGEQGTNLLLFSFPMMFIAALSCVYLHLQKQKTNNDIIRRRLASWRNPVCVKAPHGIVSSVEICFLVMFVALLVWSLANYLYISFGHLHMHKEGEKIWQAKFRSVSLRLGYIGNTCWAFLFFPVTRGSSILPLFGLTSESSIKYHIWLGHLSMVLFAAHTVGFVIYWAMTDQMVLMLEWSQTYVSNVAGEIAIVFALVIWATSISRVRRKMFEVFYYTHHLYTVCIIFYVLHVGSAYLCMILPGIFLFVIDRYLRFLQSRDRVRLLSTRLLPGGTFELNFAKSPALEYNPTSILFINVPTISKLQWHPFTISSKSNMEPDKLSIVIKTEGSWSQRLYKHLSSSIDHLEVSVEGPYGPTSFSFLRHEALIMVSGGSGITPFISIIREIMFQSTKSNSQIPRVVLICAFKNSADLAMLDLLLPISGTHADQISQMQLQIEAYVTQEKEKPTKQAQKPIQTILYKPNPLDSPISPTLGPNSWLWLGAIIASSFVLFLLVLGLVTRYYVYPVDHNTGDFYHYSYRCLWDMFLACACICLVSSLVFVWTKRRNDLMDNKQTQNLEMVMPPASSQVAWSYVAGDHRELESLPKQSLAHAMKVHFGARPDLKKILFESKASDVGVLVCGPRKMRHEVAKICASGLADNLHFESISFNW
ncbi:Cytochrome b245, heavy chain [Parasponia andersonii]|uniref:ferric-chelate reductase (NADH) n=1 Tax=Parasponia andersonii TaxID=3476 RepID=A0A2P5CAW5_PARAD|nr:Cytochrome b245, heavy chain [Parasponia andersonii]